MTTKDILGAAAVTASLLGYVPYFYHIYKGQTKPHPFSWSLWGIMTTIILFIQILNGAGPGAWVTAFTAIIAFAIAIAAWRVGEHKFAKFDYILLAASILSLFLWWLTKQPLVSVVLLIIADGSAFFMTFKKSYYLPQSETVTTYFFSAIKSTLSLFALQNLTLTTGLFPFYLVIANSLFVFMTLLRRRQLKNTSL